MFKNGFSFIQPYISNKSEKAQNLEIEIHSIIYDDEILDYLNGKQKELAEKIINIQNSIQLGRFFVNMEQFNILICSLNNIYLSKPHKLLKKYAKSKNRSFINTSERVSDLYNWTTIHLQCSKDIVLDYMNTTNGYDIYPPEEYEITI